jgi:outer membrane protein assembly factor BamD (BamD/ComL family)
VIAPIVVILAAAAVPPVPGTGESWNDLCLRRAVAHWWLGQPERALSALAERDPALPESDAARAELVRAFALYARGERSAFRDAAGKLGDLDPGDGIDALLLAAGDAADSPLLRDALLARGAATAEEADAAWERVTRAEPRSAPERALIVAARARLAARAIASGADPAKWLDPQAGDVPASELDHLRGRAALERGDDETASATLRALLAADPEYPRADDVRRELATAALRQRRWDAGYALLVEAERGRAAERAALDSLAARVAGGDDADLWAAWSAAGDGPGTLLVDPARVEAEAAAAAERLLDLRHEPGLTAPAISAADLRVAAGTPDLPASLRAPDAAERARVAAAADSAAAARRDAGDASRRLADERDAAAREGEYLDGGAGKAAAELRAAAEAAARAEALLARVDEIVARLSAARDAEVRRIAERTARFTENARRNVIVARALLHFRWEGPSRRETLPPGIPSPGELLELEVQLVTALESWFATFAETAPLLVARSHDEIWVPRAKSGPRRLADLAALRSAEARRLGVAIAAARDSARAPARFAPFEQAVTAADRRARDLASVEAAVRGEIAAQRIDDARARLDADAEAIAYPLAVAAHERGAAAGDTEEGRRLRAEAAARYTDFLEAYPGAAARSEVRFRLADAQLALAQDAFRENVTRFLGTAPSADDWNRPELAPFVDYEPALEQYLAILEEDSTWVRRDAALFHAGMILSDGADPRGRALLDELVERHPQSVHAAEAHLRLGDELFDQGEWSACLPHFQSAAAGADAEITAIALYKEGWANYSLTRFDEAARAYVSLLDHYAANPDAARTTDLREESADHLVHCLARGGGASAFARTFDAVGPRPWEPSSLVNLSTLLRDVSLFEEAASCDSLWLARWPADAEALAAARRLVETRERAGSVDATLAARLDLASRFRRGSAWSDAQSDSVRAQGDEFARSSLRTVALHHHHAARETGSAARWRSALDVYATLLEGWPEHEEAATFHYYSGEAAAALAEPARAVKHFETAAAAVGASFATDAAWQAVAARDAWYESTDPKDADLARALTGAIDAFAAGHPGDARLADLRWRRATVSLAHGWRDEAATAFALFAEMHPGDARTLTAARLRAQTLYELERWDEASAAYDAAAVFARASGADSLAAELEPLVPHCRFLHGERLSGEKAAVVFEEVAARWPSWEHADRALYRGGLAWQSAGRPSDAVRSWTSLVDRHPKSEYARDALLRIAETWEKDDRPALAAAAFRRFSETFPEDEDAGSALLRAADLLIAAGEVAQGEAVQDSYLARWPGDLNAAFAILEGRAGRELAALSPEEPISRALGDDPRAANLRRYLDLAAQHDSLASTAILAEVRFRHGEEARGRLEQARLTWPLEPAVAKKRKLLENALTEYRACSEYAVAPWNQAAVFRIGECLVGFGDALMESDRPADLEGDDLAAYEQVLEERSWDFWDRGEETWTELVRRAAEGEVEGDWVERAESELWPRIARRFSHRPEVAHPWISAAPPEEEDAK